MKYMIAFALVSIIGVAVAMYTTTPGSNSKSGAKNIAPEETAVADTNYNVCNLSPARLNDRLGVLQQLGNTAIERKELADGFAWSFPGEDKWFNTITEIVSFERKCCEPLSFKIIVEAHNGPIWLEVSGADGTKEFLKQTIGFQTEADANQLFQGKKDQEQGALDGGSSFENSK